MPNHSFKFNINMKGFIIAQKRIVKMAVVGAVVAYQFSPMNPYRNAVW
jgi:hypothetical protein